MHARSTRWLAVVLVAAAAVVWFAFSVGGRDSRDASAVEEPAPGIDAHADADLRADTPLPGDEGIERRTGVVAAETGAGARSAVAAPRELALTLVDPRHALVEGARWVAFRGDAVLASGTTADDGAMLVRLEAPPTSPTSPTSQGDRGDGSAFELAVLCTGFHPLRARVWSEPAEQLVVLGAGVAISGVVRVDGVPPAEPFALRLSADEPFWAPDELPEPVAVELMRRARAVSLLDVKAGADGAFRFAGLAVGWSGRLSWSNASLANPPPSADPLVPPQTRRVDVTAPRTGLVLDLVSPCELVGVVVDPATGEPVPGPWIEASWITAESGTTLQGTFAQDGTFKIAFADELPVRVDVTVGDNAGAGRNRHVVEIPRGLRRFDAGTLAIAWTRDVAFRVRDGEGLPIGGARVAGGGDAGVSLDDSRWGPAVSDADGLGTVAVPLAATVLRAAALGYEPALVALPAPVSAGAGDGPAGVGDPRVEIVLRPATTLELVLPSDMRALGVAIQFGDEEPFVKDGAPSWFPQFAPSHGESTTRSGAGGFARYGGSKDGRYVFGGVRPGLTLAVAAADRYGNLLAERFVAPLAPGERREVELVVERELRTLAGRVVDAAGEPVPRASVQIGPVGGLSFSGDRADDDGRFRFENLAADRVTVLVDAEVAPAKRFPALRVEATPVRLALDVGREVRIDVVGVRGEPVPNLWIEPEWSADARWSGKPVEEPLGTYVVAAAPQGTVEFTVHVGGRGIPGRVEAGADSARIELASVQTCTVALAGDRAVLESAAGHASVVLRGLGEHGGWLSERVEPGVLEVRFERVYPGRFEAYAQRQGINGTQRLSDPVELAVTADAPARVELVLREP